jgi:hypothetical protein
MLGMPSPEGDSGAAAILPHVVGYFMPCLRHWSFLFCGHDFGSSAREQQIPTSR